MLNNLFRRFSLSIIALIGITLIVFVLSHVVPGDPARLAAGPQARQEQVESVRKEYGLDKPLPQQYLIYMKNLFTGDLGKSLQSRRPVTDDLRDYFPATLELTLFATVIAVIGGVFSGLVSAVRKNQWIDHLNRVVSLAGVSIPVFWLGLVLVLIFYRSLGWLPFGGRLDPALSPPAQITGLYILDSLLTANWPVLWSSLAYLILPAVTLAFGSLGVVSRMTRASLLDVLQEDYIRTARGKGLRERVVLMRHALKNALIPVITIIGLQFGSLLGGAFLVEVIFSWPGIGTYAMKAIMFLDYNGIIGVTLLTGIIFMITNLLVDLTYIVIDPRIRAQ
ncbi:MAG: ABC transporter permease [Anaerolineaceae bacterium]|jgi:ABC-type dipeptide/oligopeptide/nickel transport systems, permease components